MGEVDKNRVNQIIENCSKELHNYIGQIQSLKYAELIYVVIVLSQYLYARYCRYGILRDNKFIVYPRDIDKALVNTGFNKFAKDIIELRNMACHDIGTDEYYKRLRDLENNSSKLDNFLKFLLKKHSISVLDSVINQVVGK